MNGSGRSRSKLLSFAARGACARPSLIVGDLGRQRIGSHAHSVFGAPVSGLLRGNTALSVGKNSRVRFRVQTAERRLLRLVRQQSEACAHCLTISNPSRLAQSSSRPVEAMEQGTGTVTLKRVAQSAEGNFLKNSGPIAFPLILTVRHVQRTAVEGGKGEGR